MTSTEGLGVGDFARHAAWYFNFSKHGQRVFCQRNLRVAVEALIGYQGEDQHGTHLDAAKEPPTVPTYQNKLCMEENPKDLARKRTNRRRGQLVNDVAQSLSLSQEPVLRVDVRSLRPKTNQDEGNGKTTSEPLEKRARLSSVECKCELTIWHLSAMMKPETSHSVSGGYVQLLRDSQLCTISRSVAGRNVNATVELDEPFFIKASKLFAPIPVNGVMTHSLGETYRLQISLYPTIYGGASPKDWPPIPVETPRNLPLRTQTTMIQTPMSDPSSFSGALESSESTSRLDALMDGFLATPVGGSSLDIKASRYRGGPRSSIDYTLQVEVLWSKPQHMKLPSCYRSTGPIQNPIFRIESKEMTHRPGEYQLSQLTVFKFVGYLCPFCYGSNMCSERLLKFHLITNHDHFDFKFLGDEASPRADMLDAMIIKVALRTKKSIQKQSNNTESWLWIRPRRRVFNLAEYLNGDDSWVTGEQVDQTSSCIPMTPEFPDAMSVELNPRQPSPVSVSPPLAVPSPPPSGPPPAPNPITSRPATVLINHSFPRRIRKKYPVPPPPANGRFFRTATNRILDEGELVSESDDDIDETWLKHQHDKTIDAQSGLTAAEKTFLKRWDAHITDEGIEANRYVADSLLRFTETNKSWLRISHPDMAMVLFKYASELIRCGSVSHAVVHRCMKMIRQTPDAP